MRKAARWAAFCLSQTQPTRDRRNFNKKIQSFNFALQKFLAAMQTNDWSVASGIRKLDPDQNTARGAIWKGIPMSKTASLGLTTNSTLFGRLLASIDRALMASAKISIRNGDLPRFGL
jgi:uncharacterized protein YfaA (DUF2138 family)